MITSRTKSIFEVSIVLHLNNQDSCTGLYTTTTLGQNQLASRIEIEKCLKIKLKRAQNGKETHRPRYTCTSTSCPVKHHHHL